MIPSDVDAVEEPPQAPPAPLPPLHRRAPRIVAIARDARRTVAAALGWDGAAFRALAQAEAATDASLRDDLQGLTRELASRLPQGEKLPREAVLLSSEVVSACVSVPGLAALPRERVETLLGWELDPFLAGDPDPARGPTGAPPVASGWSRAPGPGPVFACGARPRARDSARDGCARAGLRLRGLYPRLGCAAAELGPASGPAVVLELGSGAVSASRVEHGRVIRTRTARCAPGSEAATALGLIPSDAALAVAGPVDDALRVNLAGEPWTEVPGPEGLPAGLLGAARHALGLPGGARLAAVPPVARRSFKLPRALAWTLIVGGLLSVAAAVVDLQLGLALAAAQAARDEAQERADRGRQVQQLRSALSALRQERALQEEVAGRGAALPDLLRQLAASIPPELELRRVQENVEDRERRARIPLVLEGVSLRELAVSRFVSALAPRLTQHGLVAGQPTVEPADNAPYYRFRVEFTRDGGVQ